MTGEFNLLDEKWIRVMDSDYNIREVSLTEALIDAHRFRDLAGELKAQDVAVLRLLLAVLHTVFSRVNEKGEPDPIEEESEALERWAVLWDMGQFPAEPIRQYLDEYRERFYLFHPTYPFYQIPEASVGTEYSAAKLNGELSESNNKVRLFPVRTGEMKNCVTFPEAARWLLYINGFDDISAKPKGKGLPSPGAGWLGRLGLVTAAGGNLFETLMLNLTLLQDGEKVWGENIPVWELECPHKEERREIPVPDNPAELLTLQSRRLLLRAEDDLVTGYFLLGGDFFPRENAFAEQMTVWREVSNSKMGNATFLPKRHNSSRLMWRDFAGLVAQGSDRHIPGVVKWLTRLKNEEILSEDTLTHLRITSVQYGDEDFFITDEYGDSLSFATLLLADKGEIWRDLVLEEIERCEKRAVYVDMLAKNIVRAAGGTEAEAGSQGERAKEEFFYRLDIPFRNWLGSMKPWQDALARDEKRKEWNDTATGIARRFGREMAEDAGPEAFVGREVTVTDKRGNTSSNYYCAPDALNRFQYQITKTDREG